MKAVAVWATGLVALTALLWILRPDLPDTPAKPLEDQAKIESILAFGTSLSAPPYDWPEALRAELSNCLNAPMQISQLAQPGANSDWAKRQVAEIISQRPDLILIEFAINDADLVDGLSLPDSRENHRAILAQLRDALPKTRIILLTTGPVQGLHLIKRYRLGAFFRLYSDLSVQFDTGLIHMHPHWAGRVNPDGLHPRNSDASAVMVPQLLAMIAPKHCTSDG